GIGELHRFAIGAKETVGPRSRGRGFAAIVGGEFLRPRVVVHDERAAADAGTLRLDQVEHQLHGHRGVQRVAAALDDVVSGPGCERIGGGDRELLRLDRLPRRVTGGDLRRLLALLRKRGNEHQRKRGQCKNAIHAASAGRFLNSSSASGLASASVLPTGMPCTTDFTASSTTLPFLVRGMSGTCTILAGTCRGVVLS